jgi:hypothetical protein
MSDSQAAAELEHAADAVSDILARVKASLDPGRREHSGLDAELAERGAEFSVCAELRLAQRVLAVISRADRQGDALDAVADHAIAPALRRV